MTTGKNFTRAITDLSRSGGVVYVVDASGALHTLDLQGYVSLTSEQLRGSMVFMDPARAEKYAELRRTGRN